METTRSTYAWVRPSVGVILRIGFLLAVASSSAPGVWAQGACCTFDSCLPAADQGECNGFNGVFLDGEDCAFDPCAPAACCFELSCATADAFSCITAGRDYAGAGTTCLDDPCDAGIGACCLNGVCSDDSPRDCDAAGATWLGAGTDCTQGLCDIGSCCEPGVCEDLALFECNAAGGGFVAGGDCINDPVPCAVENDCALNSFYSQSPDTPNAFTAYVSELAGGLQRFEDYSGALGEIDELRWWGLDMFFVGGEFVDCTEAITTFQISFHADAAGSPGAEVCSETVNATATLTGIDYAGSELLEYVADLSTPCVAVEGWVSIVGLGSPDCWFLWLSSQDGDHQSYCDNCEPQVESDDLAVCIGGDKGGVFGACCDQSTGTCEDAVEIQNCIDPGDRFEQDTLCAELDPPCAAVSGGCCFGDGSCFDDLASSCVAAGGDWLGAGASCDLCPQKGACCFTQDSCSIETPSDCAEQGFTFLGIETTCDECPATPECPAGSLFTQSPNDPDDFLAGTSEESANLRRWEDFSGVAGAVDSVSWWGLDMRLVGNDFVECVESTTDFDISFHADAGGVPGAEVCSYTLNSSYTPTGIQYLGAELNEYGVTLPSPCTMVNGWVSIVGLGDPDCWFLWMSSDLFGDSWCDNCTPSPQDFDVNACFGGEVGGVFGACCDDQIGSCSDAAEITDCLNPMLRFVPDETCAALDPPCGTILGACCENDSTCSIQEAVECDEGQWLGADTLCNQCPCITPCPPGGLAEGEPPCEDDYEDTFNGGCSSPSQLFTPISLGDTICGESGVFLEGLEETPDMDWYELTVTEPTEIIWSAKAQFRPRLWIYDAASGCPGNPLASNSALECADLTISAEVDPGTYWLVIHPNGFSDSAACPSTYTATVTGNPLTLTLNLDRTQLVWTEISGTVRYDVVRGDLGLLHGSNGNFTSATEECLVDNAVDPFLPYTAEPPAGVGFWFLVRVIESGVPGTYDSFGSGQVGLRDAEIEASPVACP